MRLVDLTGQRYRRLVVIRDTGNRMDGAVVWECLCQCGQTVMVSTKSWRKRGSCGCIRRSRNPKPVRIVEAPRPVQPMNKHLWDREVWEPIETAIALGYGDMPWSHIYRVMAQHGGVLPPREVAA